MVRPKKIRLIYFEPGITYFKPKGVSLNTLEEVVLTFDELESIRLSSLEKLNQVDAANIMNVHQSTFQRILAKAREKIADALIFGKAIKILGGEYKMPNLDGTGPVGAGRRLGRGFRNVNSNDVCICPTCGHEEQHVRGRPCNQVKCPKCNTLMTRK